VFVERDASLGIAQESRQSCLAFEKRAIAQNHPLAIATTYAELAAPVGERRFCFARSADDALAWSASLFWSRCLMASATNPAQSLQGIVFEEGIELVRPLKGKDRIVILPENRRRYREAFYGRRFGLCRKGRDRIAR
jgi:hypothetical protein